MWPAALRAIFRNCRIRSRAQSNSSDQSEDDLLGGSAQLRRLVVTKAQEEVDGLPLAEVIDRRPMRRALIAFSTATLLALIGIVLDSASVRTALVRLVSPLGSRNGHGNITSPFASCPRAWPPGQALELELIDSAGHRRTTCSFSSLWTETENAK